MFKYDLNGRNASTIKDCGTNLTWAIFGQNLRNRVEFRIEMFGENFGNFK